jgi:hypothetical protein
MESIINLSEQTEFAVGSMSFGVPKVGGAGGKSVGIFYNKGMIRAALPKMIQWGAGDYKDKDGVGNGKFEFTLQFPTEDYKTPETAIALEHLKQFEARVLKAAHDNSMLWFGKKYTPEVLLALWTPMLKHPKDKTTGDPNFSAAPGFKIKLPFWEGQPKFEIYNEDSVKLFPNENGPTAVDLIEKGISINTLVQCGGVWIAGGKFGVTWKLLQAVLPNPKPSIMGTCFLKKKVVQAQVESDDEDDFTPPPPQKLTRQKTISAASDPLVDDSDEEDGESKAKTAEEPAAPAQTFEQDSQLEQQKQEQDPQQEVVVQTPQPVVQEKKKISKRK